MCGVCIKGGEVFFGYGGIDDIVIGGVGGFFMLFVGVVCCVGSF